MYFFYVLDILWVCVFVWYGGLNPGSASCTAFPALFKSYFVTAFLCVAKLLNLGLNSQSCYLSLPKCWDYCLHHLTWLECAS